jgi:hypothetical protein
MAGNWWGTFMVELCGVEGGIEVVVVLGDIFSEAINIFNKKKLI